MANANALKTRNKVSDPEPPTPEVTTGNLKQPPRQKATEKEPTVSLQVKPRESYNERFCEGAYKEFGLKRGSKTYFFEKLLDFYEENHPA